MGGGASIGLRKNVQVAIVVNLKVYGTVEIASIAQLRGDPCLYISSAFRSVVTIHFVTHQLSKSIGVLAKDWPSRYPDLNDPLPTPVVNLVIDKFLIF